MKIKKLNQSQQDDIKVFLEKEIAHLSHAAVYIICGRESKHAEWEAPELDMVWNAYPDPKIASQAVGTLLGEVIESQKGVWKVERGPNPNRPDDGKEVLHYFRIPVDRIEDKEDL